MIGMSSLTLRVMRPRPFAIRDPVRFVLINATGGVSSTYTLMSRYVRFPPASVTVRLTTKK